MNLEYIDYDQKTGKNSKQIETYNFHKVAAVLVEYGFDCIRVSDDWEGADFMAHHKSSGVTLMVQLKSGLVVDKKYQRFKDLYMCFPLDRTGNWYLVKHSVLMEIVKKHAWRWLESNRWKQSGMYWSFSATKAVRVALESYALRSRHNDIGFREAGERAASDSNTSN